MRLKVNSFNWDGWFQNTENPCELKVEQAKGKKDRIVLVPSNVLIKYIEFYIERQRIGIENTDELKSFLNNASGLILVDADGEGVKGIKIWRIIKKLSKNALNIEIRPHELRHARATELEDDGLSIRTIQHYLGHSSPQITEVYLHTSEKQSLSKVKEVMKNEEH